MSTVAVYVIALPLMVLGIVLISQSQNFTFIADAQTVVAGEDQIFSLQSYLLIAGLLLLVGASLLVIIKHYRKEKNG